MRTLLALAAGAVLACAGAAAASAAPTDHDRALASLADVRAAVAEIVRIEDGYAVGHASYQRAAHRVLNALVGSRDPGYDAAAGDPGDRTGALGHLDALLDRNAVESWTPAIQGAKVNLLAAAQNAQDALGEREMEEYQGDLTQALANLALAVGRPAVAGVLGGIDGALANTVLGVPAGARTVWGCAAPARAPAYGVVRGRLAYVALPRAAASGALPAELSIGRVVVTSDAVVLYTRGDTASLCRAQAQRTRERVRTRAAAPPHGAGAPYTAAQARAGAKVYATSCLSCHGANLQGTAAPGVAGSEFITTARKNAWSLEDLRTLVFENMPLSNPGSLSPPQYASVMAFLLASNCYPAGTKPFPTGDDPAFAKLKLGPVRGAKPTNPKLGTCGVK